MKKETLIVGFFMVIICSLLIAFAPDGLSRAFVVVQSITMILGFIFGILRVSRYSRAFQYARGLIHITKKEQTVDNLWSSLSRNDNLFQIDALNSEFVEFRENVASRKQNANSVLPDIEDVFNEETVSIKTWRGAINQIPETLTGIGILGTFVGLIIGIGSIGFSSVAAALSSLKTLISGIEVAFYTSIVGLVLSICFNLIYKFFWNVLLRDLNMFVDDFHRYVIASEDTQIKELQVKYYTAMLKRFENFSENE